MENSTFNGFGNPDEWAFFEAENPRFEAAFYRLQDIFSRVYTRMIAKERPDADRVIFDLGLRCCTEFSELALLCANGYGIAGQRVLRTIYESAVVADYLHVFPDEATDFLDYGDVHLYKHFVGSGVNQDPDLAEEWEYVRENYERVKTKFETTLCKKCGTKRPMHSWNKMDPLSQAKASSSPLEPLYQEAYFQPTLQIHATMPSIFARMHIDPETDRLYITDKKQIDTARSTLRLAHLIILSVLYTQEKHFKLGLESDLIELMKDADECWMPDSAE